MGEADKYRQQGDPQHQNQHQGQSQNQGGYQNQAQYNQGYNNNTPAYNGNQQQQQPMNGYQDHPYGPPPPYSFNPPQREDDEKYSFNDAFKLEKPKYNDWWAGLLVCASPEGSFLLIHSSNK